MIGSRLGPFEIRALLGEGGMGAVYRAEDTRLGREVAIKVLPEAFTSSEDRLARFEREAQVVASLNHPNICALYDVGRDGETHYLVMELIEGESLGERVARGLEPDEAVGIAVQIAEALEAAHERGIVHRDLKPANVMITTDGTVKVLDFGLAKGWTGTRDASPDPSHSPTISLEMTQAGMILGSAGYMSPEQARGHEADPRSDVWAWGVVLYEMLAGRRLFDGPTVSDTLAAVLRADLEWDALPDRTPRWVRSVLRRCLARDPKNRLHSIADARIELTDSEPDGPGANGSLESARRTRVPGWIAAVVAIVAVAIGIAGWWTRSGDVELPLRILDAAHGGRLTNAAISPDGRSVALIREGRLLVRALDSPTEVEIPGVGDVAPEWSLFWSPDGRRVGYVTGDAIYTVPVSGGGPQLVCPIPDATYSEGIVLGATWSGPDALVFALDYRGLWRVPVLGGDPELVLPPDAEGKNEAALHHPFVLPDGETIGARVRWRGKANDTVTFLRDGRRTDVTYEGWNIGEPLVTASGYLVFTRHDQDDGLWAAPFSVAELRTTGDPVRLLAGRFEGLSVAADDTLMTVLARQGREEIVRIDRDGAVVRALEGLGPERDPAVSPDGSDVAVWGIRVYDGKRVVDVTPDSGSGPAWSPDGRELVYQGRDGLYRVPADGSRDPVRLFEGRIKTPHWSPDGAHVAFSVWRDPDPDASEREVALRQDERSDIVVVDLDGDGEPRPFRDSEASELYPRFSPDGRFLAYASDSSGRFEIYVTKYPEGDRRWSVSTDGGRFPRWSADGGEIYYVAGGNLMTAPFRGQNGVEIGAPTRLLASHDGPFLFSGFGQAMYDVTPGGGFVVNRIETDNDRSAILVQNWPRLFENTR